MKMVILHENDKNKFQLLDLNRWMRLKVLLNVKNVSFHTQSILINQCS
jgi:hypothetical protein